MLHVRCLLVVFFMFTHLLNIKAALGLGMQTEVEQTGKVMYLGGAAGVRGKSMSWDNVLSVTRSAIHLRNKNTAIFEIDPSSVIALSYSGHRHVNDTAFGVAVLAAGVAGLSALAIKSTDHYVAVEYTLPDGTPSGVLLRLHKSSYKEILKALHKVTGIKEPALP